MLAGMMMALTALGLAASPDDADPAARAPKRIAITIDDAPTGAGPLLTGPERTRRLIASLAEAEAVPAAFFVTTKGLRTSRGGRNRIVRYAEAGHLIANHSDRHLRLSRTDLKAYLRDLDRAERRLEGFAGRRPWFRFPYLDEGGGDLEKRDAMREALRDRGLMSGYATVDAYDWHILARWKEAEKAGRSVDLSALRRIYIDHIADAADHYAALSEAYLGRQPAHVIVLHENDLAALFIDEAVAALRSRGWTIISPEEAYSDPVATKLPETGFSGMGRVAALVYDSGGRGAEVFDHWSVSRDAIDQRLEAAGVFSD